MSKVGADHGIVRFFYGLLCLFALIFLFRGELQLWHISGPTLFPFIYWRRILLGAVLLLGIISLVTRRSPGPVPAGVGLGGILLVFASDWLDNPYSLLRGPSIRGEILLGTIAAGALLYRGRTDWIRYVSFMCMLGLFGTLVYASRGALIFSDDHPVFLQRLILLKQNFPAIPFFNPLWNAGIDQRDFFATGALNVFLILSPLIYLLDLSRYYTVVIATLLFAVVPGAIALATWLYGRSRLQASIAAMLAVGNSLLWYRWALKYGTLGFICSSSLIPLVLVLATLLTDRESRWSLRNSLLLIASTTLMLLWSPTGLVCIPLGLWSLLRLRILVGERRRLLSVAGILAINIPWILLFLSVSRVSNYVSKETIASRRVVYSAPETSATMEKPVEQAAGTARVIHKIVHDWASSENPLILFLTIPGLFLLRRPFALTLGGSILWAALLGTVGSIKMPQLELDRMLLIAGLIATIPCSLLLEWAVMSFSRGSLLHRLLTALTVGMLCATPFSTASILVNRTVEHYQTATPLVQNLSDAIRLWGGQGRVLFSGFILHELNGGHVAPLAFWTDHELIASSHVHDKWWYTNVIPESYLARGDSGVEEYLDLLNVTAVVAHERTWIQYFQNRPALYRQRWAQDRFTIFERSVPSPSFLLQGKGEVLSRTSSSITVKAETPDIVLKYNYYPFLTSSACALSSESIDDQMSFIRLSGCPTGVPIVIHSRPGWTRIFGGFK